MSHAISSFLTRARDYVTGMSSERGARYSLNLDRMGPKECIRRIQEVARILNQKMYLTDNNTVCSITCQAPQDPVITNCRHVFERGALATWRNHSSSCPSCRTPITHVGDLPDSIPGFTLFIKEDKARAAEGLARARRAADEGRYEAVLTVCREVCAHTKASEDYVLVPEAYEKLRLTAKAALAHLHLALYQLQEGKTEKAFKTLEESLKIDGGLPITAVLISLMLSLHPYSFEKYDALLPLLRDPEEKKYLLLKAAAYAKKQNNIVLASRFREQRQAVLLALSFSQEMWTNPLAFLERIPPYPRVLEDFLNGDCTIWSGKKRRDTHMSVPLFSTVIYRGSPVPRTLASLDKLDKDSGGTGFRYGLDRISHDTPAGNFRWGVMTKEPLPETRNKSYAEQIKIVQSYGYKMPNALDAATAVLWHYRCSGERCFSDNPWTYMRCTDKVREGQLIVGGFVSEEGLAVNHNSLNLELMGAAGWNEF